MVRHPQAFVAGTPQAGADPAAVYRALRDQGQILREQQSNLQNQRQDLQGQYDQMSASNPGREGIAKRMTAIDTRIGELDQQIAKSDQAIATQSAIPGATTEPPSPPRTDPDPEMIVGLGFVVVMTFAIPISIAYARRIWRRSAKTEVTLPPQMMDRMESLERGMEAVALEVERIGESQRFLTQAMTDRLDPRALGAGAAQPVPVRQGERMEHRR